MTRHGSGRGRSGRALLARRGWPAASALLGLCACDGVFDLDGWHALLEEHHGAPGAACGSPGQPFGPLGSVPADRAVDVEPGALVSVTFSRPLDAASASLAALELLGPGAEPVAGSVSAQGCSLRYTPDEPLLLNTAYLLRLAGAVRARHGAEWSGTFEAELRIRDGVWSDPVQVSGTGDTPRLAVARDGSAVLAWQVPAQLVSASVALAGFTPGGGWQQLPLSGAGGGPYSIPRSVQLGAAGIELLWYNTGELYAGVYRLGQGLGETTERDYQASTPDGDGAITGESFWAAANERAGIVLKHTSGGAPWSEQTIYPVLDTVSERPSGPRLTADGSGQLRAFWLSEQALLMSTLGAGQSPTGWSAPQPLVPREPGSAVPVAFGLGSPFADAESPLGHSLLAWQEDEPAPAAAESATSRLRVVWVAPDGSVDDSRPAQLGAPGNAFSPALAMNASGGALLAWVESTASASDSEAPSSIRAALRSGEAPWSTALSLPAPEQARARAPAVALDASGNGHAVWLELAPDGSAVLRAARLTGDTGGFGDPSVISGAAAPAAEPPAYGGNAPQLAVDPAGRALAVWAAASGGVWSARFE